MLYSQSCEYAIRALSYLALQPKGKFSPVQEIAKHQKIPKYFLGKLLQMLAKRGLVESTRGPGGGWTIKPKATQISLLKIVECTDGLVDLERCLLGLGCVRFAHQRLRLMVHFVHRRLRLTVRSTHW